MFESVTGSGYRGDIAVDGITLGIKENCVLIPENARLRMKGTVFHNLHCCIVALLHCCNNCALLHCCIAGLLHCCNNCALLHCCSVHSVHAHLISNFHMKDFAPGLALKQRRKATR